MSLIRQYLSMEDHDEPRTVEVEVEVEIPEVQDVTEDERHEASHRLEEDYEEHIATEKFFSDAYTVDGEVNEHVESLEDFVEVLDHGLENQQFSPQFAAVLSSKLSALQSLRDTDVPSLEDFGHDDLEDFYAKAKVALEDHVSDVSGIKPNVIERLINNVVDKTVKTKRAKTADSLIKSADAALNDLSALKGADKVEVSLSGLAGKIAVMGALPGQLPAAAGADQKALEEIFGKYTDDAVKCHGTLHDLLEKTRKTTDVGAIQGLAKEMVAVKRPEDNLSDGIRTGKSLLGNVKVDVDATEKKDGDTVSQLKALKSRRAPKYVSAGSAPKAEKLVLSKADIVKLLQLVKAYGVMIKKANDSLTSQMKTVKVNSFKHADKTAASFSKATSAEKKQRKLMAEAAFIYAHTFIPFISRSFGHATDSGRTLLKLSERAIGKIEDSVDYKKDDE